MAGTRQRCVYCSDSRAADVEHFFPLSPYFDRAFSWANMLWICPECNRKKNNSFPLAAGAPLLLDPSVDEPWEFLVLDTNTGMLAPRYVGGTFDARGEKTLEVLDLLLDESVVEGRSRSIRRLREATEECLADNCSTTACKKLLREVADDEFGVASWFALSDGNAEVPFSTLAATCPSKWRRFVRYVMVKQHG